MTNSYQSSIIIIITIVITIIVITIIVITINIITVSISIIIIIATLSGSTYQKAQLGPVMNEITIRVDGIRFRKVLCYKGHDGLHLQFRLV